jgi:MoaA/NifB/PqqE/SkfB family radical SAM enzyme
MANNNPLNSEFCLFQTDKKRIIWEITRNCNYSCKHCCSSSENIIPCFELSFEQIVTVLNDLKLYGIEEIYYSGGEPFSRKDMLDILEETSNRDIKCNISTNGFFINQHIINRLKTIKLGKIHISLDNHKEKDYNLFRGGDYFFRTISAIELIKRNNLYSRIGVVIWKNNVDEIEDIILFLINLGVDEVVFNWLVKVGRLTENKSYSVDLQRFDEVVSRILSYQAKYADKIKVTMHRSNCFVDSDNRCDAATSLFHISPEGEVSPCSWIKKQDSQYTS